MDIKKLTLALLTAFAATACAAVPQGKPAQETKTLNMPVQPYADPCDEMRNAVCWGVYLMGD